jgi:hypothetical protein
MRYAIALLRSGAPARDFEPARAYASMVEFFERLVEGAERAREMAERALRQIIRSPRRTVPCPVPLVLLVPASSQLVGLSHAPHAPPCSLSPGNDRDSFHTVASGVRALMA